MNIPASILLCVLFNSISLSSIVNGRQSVDNSTKHTQNLCNKYFLVPDDIKADLSSAQGSCSSYLIGFGILGDLMGLTGMCYKIAYTNYICPTSHSLTIRAWHMTIRWNGTETFLWKKETTPSFQTTLTCKDVQSTKYYFLCREDVHMVELTINNNSTETKDYLIETSNDMTNIVNVIGGILGGVLSSIAGVAFKTWFDRRNQKKSGTKGERKDTDKELGNDEAKDLIKNSTTNG